jgi:hypothetical protein
MASVYASREIPTASQNGQLIINIVALFLPANELWLFHGISGKNMSLRFIASRWLRKGLLRSPHACLMGRANSGWRRPFPYPTTPGNDIFEEIPDRTSKLIECGLFDRKVRAVGQLAELLRAGHFLKHRHTHCGRSPAFSPGVHRKEWEFVIETQRPVPVKRTEEPGPHPFFTYQGVASEIGLHVRVTAQCQHGLLALIALISCYSLSTGTESPRP